MKIRCIPARKAAAIAIASFFLFFNAHNVNYAQSTSFTQGKKEQPTKVITAKHLAELQRAKEFIEKAKISIDREKNIAKSKDSSSMARSSEANAFLDSANASLQKYEAQEGEKNENGKNMFYAFIAGAVISLIVYFAIKLSIMHATENK